MKKLFLTLTLAITALTLTANPVDYQTARTIAENFAIAQRVPAPDVISLVPEQTFTQLYVFGFRGQKGFVIISADDRAIPVLAYSLTTEFKSTNIPGHILGWLHDYENQINWLVDNNIPASEEVHRRWNDLQESQGDTRQCVSTKPNARMAEIIVDALVEARWSQEPYYNNFCPEIGGLRVVTGCVATATAQIMRHWNLPTTGHGSHSYEWNGQTLSANFGNTTYEWANMPDSLNASSTSAQVNAVATLMYHVGVAVDMLYGLSNKGGSAADISTVFPCTPSAEFALRNFFKYDNNLHSIYSWAMSENSWKNTLKSEFDNGRPVLYAGFSSELSGHAFICDGYDSQDFFHFNWGWGGRCDGFYAIGSLNPGGDSYSFLNMAVVGIQPINGSIPSQTEVTAAANDTAKGYVTGSGTYNQYDTIKLTAFAREGYVFDHWDDNCAANPRYSTATSASYNHTAYFKPIPQDTIGYCLENATNGLGDTYGTYEWGFRYPASTLRPGRVVDGVQLFPIETNQYTVILYQGDSTHIDSVYAETFTIQKSNNWVDMLFATPYNIDTTRSLWVTLRCVSPGDCMTYSGDFSGNRDGMMYKENSTWKSYVDDSQYMTWMLRALTCDSSQHNVKYVVRGIAAPADGGSVTPIHSRIYAGTEVVFTATPADNHIFVAWDDSCSKYNRKITPTSDTTLTAMFSALRPDTATYCAGVPYAMFEAGGSFKWGIRIRAGLYTQGDSLRSVMIFDSDSATLDLAIYSGEQPNGSPLHSGTFTTTGSMSWITLPLSKPVACPEDEDLWVIFSSQTVSDISAYATFSGNPDGSYSSEDGVDWDTSYGKEYDASWAIKVIATRDTTHTAVDNLQTLDVTLAPNPIHAGETAYIYGDWSDAELAGMHVELLTIDGKTITRTAPRTFPIALRGITAPGTYIIKITTGTGSLHIRKLTVN